MKIVIHLIAEYSFIHTTHEKKIKSTGKDMQFHMYTHTKRNIEKNKYR